MLHALSAHTIRYAGIMQGVSGASTAAVAARLMEKLPPLWNLAYRRMSGRDTEILEIKLATMLYHFDSAGGGEDRVVVLYGFSDPSGQKRDSSRMHEPLGGGISDRLRSMVEEGHFASHAQGGPMNLNRFPHRPDVNPGRADGWSTRGVSFRKMETWCVENPGAFFFARPIYVDESSTPGALEYGILRSPTDLWVERFPN